MADAQARLDAMAAPRAARRREWEASAATGTLLRGTCLDMCPEHERWEREAHLDVSAFEALEGDGPPVRIDHSRAVKKYHRSSAGNEAPLPEDVRPPAVLRRTMDYLLDAVLDGRQDISFASRHRFLRDRTRGIRQDVVLQLRAVLRDMDVAEVATIVELHEQAARFHALSGHRLCEEPPGEFDAFQNTEQLRKVLTTLHELYVDVRAHAATMPAPMAAQWHAVLRAEPEFRAYELLTHAEDPDALRRAMSLSPDVFASPAVTDALAAVCAMHQGDYVRYVRAIAAAPYLTACLMHGRLPRVRADALARMARSYTVREAIPEADVCRWLMLEDRAELTVWAAYVKAAVRDDGGLLFVSPAPMQPSEDDDTPRSIPAPRVSSAIEAKALGVAAAAIVRGLPGGICSGPASSITERAPAARLVGALATGSHRTLSGSAPPPPRQVDVQTVACRVADEIVCAAAEECIRSIVSATLVRAYRDRIVSTAAESVLQGLLRSVAQAEVEVAVSFALERSESLAEAFRQRVVLRAAGAVFEEALCAIATEVALSCASDAVRKLAEREALALGAVPTPIARHSPDPSREDVCLSVKPTQDSYYAPIEPQSAKRRLSSYEDLAVESSSAQYPDTPLQSGRFLHGQPHTPMAKRSHNAPGQSTPIRLRSSTQAACEDVAPLADSIAERAREEADAQLALELRIRRALHRCE